MKLIIFSPPPPFFLQLFTAPTPTGTPPGNVTYFVAEM